MKNLFKFISVFLFVIVSFLNSSVAQVADTLDVTKFDVNHLPKPGTIVSTKAYKKFIGTWVSQDAKNELTLKLEIYNAPFGNPPIYLEMLVGGYKFMRSGTEIANTLNKKPVYAKLNEKNSNNELVLGVRNMQTMRESLFTVKLLDENTMMISPNYSTGEGIKKDPKLDYFNNLSLKRQ